MMRRRVYTEAPEPNMVMCRFVSGKIPMVVPRGYWGAGLCFTQCNEWPKEKFLEHDL